MQKAWYAENRTRSKRVEKLKCVGKRKTGKETGFSLTTDGIVEQGEEGVGKVLDKTK